MQSQEYINRLNDQYFDGQLSASFQERLSHLPIDRPDVLTFVERMFGFMKQAGIQATDMSTMMGDILGTLLARILPGAWEGRVPPITIPGRHALIDEFMKSNPWITSGEKSMMDIGCGFPPYTTLETAAYFPEWKITGVDPSLPYYLLHDADGNYATLDQSGATIYFQPAVPSVENWNQLLKNAGDTRQAFESLLQELIDAPAHGETDLPRLEINPIQSYESDSLTFIQGGIGQVTIEKKDVIRCFNVLFYFDDPFYEKALEWFAEQLKEGGLLIIGANWAVSTECYYHVYQKVNGVLITREFAFSLDCICPVGIVSWYANYDDDRQTAELVKFIRIIREDKSYMAEFYKKYDAIREKYGICPRDEDGYYGMVDPSIGPQELWMLARTLLDELNDAGLNQKAVNVLTAAGFKARVNEVGHIAISV